MPMVRATGGESTAAPDPGTKRDGTRHRTCKTPRMSDVGAGSTVHGSTVHGLELREPAHQVSPRAVPYWTVSALLGDAIVVGAATVVYVLVPGIPGWVGAVLVLAGLLALAHVVLMPRIRFRVHRWEVTDTAVHTRAGWIGRQTRIAPISRVQTVDSRQGALMRLFGLASITVTTASAAGPITLDCLDQDTAREVVARLTAITAATEGDAT